ncbi:glucose PTS transporter subunit EIIB [Streptomyces sp. NPDC014882]|uniref:glucose PTS transporter subunit EIIB n=1 Tax=Streptomyces sp. NPDC014882 TaxID=3364927 RepID=UPI0036FE4343
MLRHIRRNRSQRWANCGLLRQGGSGRIAPSRPGDRATGRPGQPRHSEGFRDSREKDMASKAEKIVAGLGGIDNIEEVEGCITRLRTEVIDASKVDEAALKAAGAHGVVKMGTAVQVVIGTDADPIAGEIEDMM